MMNTSMGFGLGWLWMVLGTVVVVGLAVWLFWSLCVNQNRPNKTSETDTTYSALSIVKQRYARGEINKEQFEEMRRSL